MTPDLALQLEIAIRLLGAAALGAAIGLEREIHEHPAGMRTHLLVSLGSAGFTVLSIYAFAGPGADSARVAAQIVTGVGFLGAGAILKEGATIRGLTTAASLWAVAGVGMAAGAGMWLVALVITAIAVFSLWPLRLLSERFVGRSEHRVRMRLATTDPNRIGAVLDAVARNAGSVAHLATTGAPGGGGLIVEIEARLPDVDAGARLTLAVAALDGVELLDSRAIGD
jgi:putative Mg2+ transporter-C (MgtC) family protein